MVISSSSSLNYTVQRIFNDLYNKNKRLEETADEVADPYDKDPPRDARNYRQNSTDNQVDTLQTARDIGTVIRGRTRLNVVSALTNKDLVDFYGFKTGGDGKLSISITTDKPIAVQLLSRSGEVIADSTAKNGAKAENFEKLGTGELEVEKGQYYLKVTRDVGEDRSTRPNYAIQLGMSRYFEQDYDTVETPASNSTYTAVGTQAASNMGSILGAFNGTLFDNLF